VPVSVNRAVRPAAAGASDRQIVTAHAAMTFSASCGYKQNRRKRDALDDDDDGPTRNCELKATYTR